MHWLPPAVTSEAVGVRRQRTSTRREPVQAGPALTRTSRVHFDVDRHTNIK